VFPVASSNGTMRPAPAINPHNRIFCNKEWELLLPDYNLIALSSSLSDHCPILLCQQLRPRFSDTFCFENFWRRVPGFSEVVKGAWQRHVPRVSPLNTLCFRLQNSSLPLKAWSRKLFANSRVELHMANEVIHRLDIVQDSRQLSVEDA
jgi:hypothetical protein